MQAFFPSLAVLSFASPTLTSCKRCLYLCLSVFFTSLFLHINPLQSLTFFLFHVSPILPGTDSQTQLVYLVPTRGMIGIRSALLTATKGTLVLDTIFDSYKPVVGAISQREKGSLLAFEEGTANPFGIAGAQDRGRMFITTKSDVYKDMIIGVHQRPGDLAVNVCKTKALTNMRAAGNDDTVKVIPPLELNLDIAVEYIQEDELVEVTPTMIRMLKHPDWKDWARKRRDL
jgi:predicted membrane GTPase involved in stress response